MSIKSVLVEYKNENKTCSSSACLISDRYVLTTSNVFISLFSNQNTPIREKLGNVEPGFTPIRAFLQHEPEVNVIINNDPYRNCNGRLVGVYLSEEIRLRFRELFNEWSIHDADKSRQLREALPLFFIVDCNSLKVFRWEEILNDLTEVTTQSDVCRIAIGQKMFIEGTPFGNRHFLGSRSRGIVSNVFENCFVLTDTPTSPGCEGSPAYLRSEDKALVPIGMVLACLCWWNGEWTGLTVVVTFSGIFSDIRSISKVLTSKIRQCETQKLIKLRESINSSLAQVTCGSTWGTAILLDKQNGVFVTNAHVVDTDRPILIYRGTEIISKLIFKADKDAYDIAIIIADVQTLSNISMENVDINRKNIKLGVQVLAAGFSLFPSSLTPKPTITAGCIAQLSGSMIKTTCAVLPGSSGGGIFDKEGKLIGLIVSNVRNENCVNPRINMVIPVEVWYEIVMDFARRRDSITLAHLKFANQRDMAQWNLLSCNL